MDNGLGDHIVFRKLINDYEIDKITIFCCYPDIFEGYEVMSIDQAKQILGDISKYNIYGYMDSMKWKDTIYNAYKKMYGINALTE